MDDGTLRYVYGLGRIAQVESDETTHYFLADALGSTMALTDDGGAVENSYEYDTFGAVASSGGSESNMFKFAGEQVDESSGLQYLRLRYLELGTGTFQSRDPLSYSPTWDESGYVYAANNPVLLVDPLGLCGLKLSLKNAKDCANDAGDAVGEALPHIGGALKQCAVWGCPAPYSVEAQQVPQ